LQLENLALKILYELKSAEPVPETRPEPEITIAPSEPAPAEETFAAEPTPALEQEAAEEPILTEDALRSLLESTEEAVQAAGAAAVEGESDEVPAAETPPVDAVGGEVQEEPRADHEESVLETEAAGLEAGAETPAADTLPVETIGDQMRGESQIAEEEPLPDSEAETLAAFADSVAAETVVEMPPASSEAEPEQTIPADVAGYQAEEKPQAAEEDEDEKLHTEARKFARLLVSEIKLYNESHVLEGREKKDLYLRLKQDIDRSREMYEQRISPTVSQKVDHFHEELVRTLGDDDPSTLGIDYPGSRV
jgi:hypothetical protein